MFAVRRISGYVAATGPGVFRGIGRSATDAAGRTHAALSIVSATTYTRFIFDPEFMATMAI
jgi:hypothetical protein